MKGLSGPSEVVTTRFKKTDSLYFLAKMLVVRHSKLRIWVEMI